MLDPIRTYETVLYGQLVTVKVYPPQIATTPTWVFARNLRIQVDPTGNDNCLSLEEARKIKARNKKKRALWAARFN